jgi:hypothetical protein
MARHWSLAPRSDVAERRHRHSAPANQESLSERHLAPRQSEREAKARKTHGEDQSEDGHRIIPFSRSHISTAMPTASVYVTTPASMKWESTAGGSAIE